MTQKSNLSKTKIHSPFISVYNNTVLNYSNISNQPNKIHIKKKTTPKWKKSKQLQAIIIEKYCYELSLFSLFIYCMTKEIYYYGV